MIATAVSPPFDYYFFPDVETIVSLRVAVHVDTAARLRGQQQRARQCLGQLEDPTGQ